jgi:hypothetical protein
MGRKFNPSLDGKYNVCVSCGLTYDLEGNIVKSDPILEDMNQSEKYNIYIDDIFLKKQ